MKRIAFKMKLKKGVEAEYKRRHDEIWPELSALLSSKGISNYSIFLDEPTGELFAVMELTSRGGVDVVRNSLAGEAIPIGLSCLS